MSFRSDPLQTSPAESPFHSTSSMLSSLALPALPIYPPAQLPLPCSQPLEAAQGGPFLQSRQHSGSSALSGGLWSSQPSQLPASNFTQQSSIYGPPAFPLLGFPLGNDSSSGGSMVVPQPLSGSAAEKLNVEELGLQQLLADVSDGEAVESLPTLWGSLPTSVLSSFAPAQSEGLEKLPGTAAKPAGEEEEEGKEVDADGQEKVKKRRPIMPTAGEKQKNRETQKRFRERQRQRLAALKQESFELAHLKAQMQEIQGQLQASQQELQMCRREKSLLLEREQQLGAVITELRQMRQDPVRRAKIPSRQRVVALHSMVGLANNLREPRSSAATANLVLHRIMECVRRSDIVTVDGTAHNASSTALPAPSAVGLVVDKWSHRSQNTGGVVTLETFMNLPAEELYELYAEYSKEVHELLGPPLQGLQSGGLGVCRRHPQARRIARLGAQLRAFMTCYAAVNPEESLCQQLRHSETRTFVEQEVDRANCQKAARVMELSREQVLQARAVYGEFKARMDATLMSRRSLLPLLQRSLYSSDELSSEQYASILSAASALQRTLEEEYETICFLVCDFTTKLLSDEQICIMVALSVPYAAHVAGLIKVVVEAEGSRFLPAPQGPSLSGLDMSFQ